MKRIVLLCCLLLAFACKKEESGAALRINDAPPRSPSSDSASTADTAVKSRMVIRNASVSLVVKDAVDALRRITAMAEARGGYLNDSKQWEERRQVRASATLRVPAAQLTPMLAAMQGIAVRVESQEISAEDVSQEGVDLNSQLRNLQATETELRELLSTVRQRTQKASEIMEIYTELTKVRGEIEKIQGRLQYLAQMTSFSTITVTLVPDALAAPVVEPGWQPLATIRSASRSLVNALRSLADAAIWLAIYLLPIVLIFVVATLVIRAVFKRLKALLG